MKKIAPAFVLLFLAACLAPGDAVGKVDAMKPSTLDVDLAAGDKLRFRVDTEVELISLEHQRLPRHKAVAFFQTSNLVVSVKDPKGSPVTVRCPLKGNGTSQGMSGSKMFETGLIVDCMVPAAQAGKHQVSATVAWDPAVRPLTATVEVRRVKN